MNNFIIVILIILFVSILMTYLLHRLFKKIRFIKYIPTALLLAAGIYFLYLTTAPSEGFQDLARVLMGILALGGSAAALITGLILDFVHRRK